MALCQDLPVRFYDKKTCNWEVPLECSNDVVLRFKNLSYCSIDPAVLGRVESHQALIYKKFNMQPTDELVSLIKTPMLKHQEKWLGFSQHFRALANLCEQGTGKTKMALDWIASKNLKFVLVVVKNSNMYKWKSEVIRHSDFEPFVLVGPRQIRLGLLQGANKFNGTALVIINYEYVQPLINELLKMNFDGIVLDESTAIKNVTSRRHKALIKLGDQCGYKLILSGTPLVNSPVDAFGQFRFLNPNILGKNFTTFKSRYCILGGFGGYQVINYKNLHELQAKIENYSYRVLKADCLDLPAKIYQNFDIDPSDEFKKRYQELVKSELIEMEDRLVDNTMMLTKITRCQQLCDGFLYEDSERGLYKTFDTPKMDVLLDFMEDHFQSSKKLIIWAKYIASIHLIETAVKKKFPDLIVNSIYGRTPVNSRQSLIDAFNISYIDDNQMRCVILQTASMMHGIDIRCDTAVYYSYSWSNEEWLQSQDRIHGINRGSGEKCTYIILGIRGTIEATILKALERKKKLSDFVLKDVTDFKDLLMGETDE